MSSLTLYQIIMGKWGLMKPFWPHETFPLDLGLFNISSSQWFEAQLILICFIGGYFYPFLHCHSSGSEWMRFRILSIENLNAKFLRHCSHYLKFIGKDFILSGQWGISHVPCLGAVTSKYFLPYVVVILSLVIFVFSL